MRPLPRKLLTIARDQHGLITTADLERERFVGRARMAALESGLLVPVHRGVYRVGTHTGSFEQRCLAALLAAPDAALAGPTAGRIWNLRHISTDDVHVLAKRAIQLDGVHPHRTDLLGQHDVTVRFDMRVLRPPRLLCDLAWHLDDRTLESVFEQMLDRKMLTLRSARSAARRFTARGRPGSRRLGGLLDSRADWLKPVDSDLELRVWRSLAQLGYDLDRQVMVTLDDGGTVRLDLGIVDLKLGIEVDHVTWHGGRLDAQGDKRRDRMLTRLGWTVVRVTDEDVEQRLATTIDDLVAIIERLTETRRSA
jgi:very-short-patch-repair endonuclease